MMKNGRKMKSAVRKRLFAWLLALVLAGGVVAMPLTAISEADGVESVAETESAAAERTAEEVPEEEPTEAPTPKPTEAPTPEPTEAPTPEPTEAPTPEPTEAPTPEPTEAPTPEPTEAPTPEPTEAPTPEPTEAPTEEPSEAPTEEPTEAPIEEPTEAPIEEPSEAPTEEPTEAPTEEPTEAPTEEPTEAPTEEPTEAPVEYHIITFALTGDAQLLAEDEPLEGDTLSVEADRLVFAVVPAREGSEIVIEAQGATLSDEGADRYALTDMADEVLVTVAVSDRLNAVTFNAAEGTHALVDGGEVSAAQAVNGELRFTVAADEGYAIASVTARELGDARLTGKGSDYILENVNHDGIVVDIAAEAEAPRTDFSYQDSRVAITAVADEAANLPQSAELKADYLAPGTDEYAEAAAAVRRAYSLGEDVVLNLAPYDIYFLDGDTRIEPEDGKVKIEIRFVEPVTAALPEDAGEAEVVDSGVLHVREDGREDKLDAAVDATETGDIRAAEFTVDSFSTFDVFTAVRTNDTTVENSGVEDLGVFVSSVALLPENKYDRIIDEEGNVTGYILQPGVSYTLKIQFDEDDGNLERQFNNTEVYYGLFPGTLSFDGAPLTAPEIDMGNSGTLTGNSIWADSENKLHIRWNKEDAAYKKFIEFANASLTLNITGTYVGTVPETWTLGNGHVLSIQPASTPKLTVNKSQNGGISYSESKHGYVVKYKVEIASEGDNTNIHVSDHITQGANIMTLDASSIQVKDAEGNAVNYQLVPSSGEDSESETTGEGGGTPNGFEIVIPQIAHKQTLTVYYEGLIPAASVYDLTVNSNGGLGNKDIENTVGVTASGYNNSTVTIEYTHEKVLVDEVVSPPALKKEGTQDTTGQTYESPTATVNWKLTGTHHLADNSQMSDAQKRLGLAGATITDRLDNQSGHKVTYTDDGLTFKATDKLGHTRTVKIPWSSLTNGSGGSIASGDDAAEWNLSITPELAADIIGGEDGLVGEIEYEITYATLVSMTDSNGIYTSMPFVVGNQAEDSHGGSGSGSATVKPVGISAMEAEKKLTSYTRERANWQIKVTVPRQGDQNVVITDTLPHTTIDGTDYYDTYEEGSLDVDGLLDGESYELTKDTETGKLILKFYYTTVDEARAQTKHWGLGPTEETRYLYITLTTLNNPEWLAHAQADTDQEKHTNTVSVDSASGSGKLIRTATFRAPYEDSVIKSLAPGETVAEVVNNPKGKYRYVFTYTVDVTGVVGSFTLKDTFDSRLSYLDDGQEHHGYPGGAGITSVDAGGNPRNDRKAVQASVSGNTLTLVANDLPKENGGACYTRYRVSYHMVMYSDYPSLSAMAGASPTGKVSIGNSVAYGAVSHSVSVTASYDTVTKEVLSQGWTDGEYIVEYLITVNPDGLDLDPDSNYLILTDDMSANLAVDYSSISFRVADQRPEDQGYDERLPESANANNLVWEFRSTTGEFRIPDGKYVEIYYKARVTGDDLQNFSNTATLNGRSVTTKSWADLTVTATGSASAVYLVLRKYQANNMNHPVAGVKFKLTDESGNWLMNNKDEGYFVTDENGLVTIEGGVISHKWTLRRNTPTREYTYYLEEVEAPEGYQKVTTKYSFQIAYDDVPIYGDNGVYRYFNGDELKIRNWPYNGALTVTKAIAGVKLAAMSHEDRAKIRFSVQKKNADGTLSDAYDVSDRLIEDFSLATMTVDKDDPNRASVSFDLPLGEYVVTETDGLTGETYTLVSQVATASGNAAAADGKVTATFAKDGDKATASFTNTYEKVLSIPVEKAWEGDADDTSGRPESVTVRLMRKLAEDKDGAYKAVDGKTLTLTASNDASNGWKGEFENLPEADEADRPYLYTVEEVLPDSSPYYLLSTVGDMDSGFVLTNKKADEETGDVVVTKAFDGIDSLPSGFRILVDYRNMPKKVDKNDWPSELNETNAVAGSTNPVVWVLKNLPAGVVVTLTEDNYNHPAYLLSASTPEKDANGRIRVVIDQVTAGRANPADFTNRYTPKLGRLEIEKAVTAEGVSADKLAGDFEGAEFNFILTDAMGNETEKTLVFGKKLTFEGLPVGAYTITEASAAETVKGYTFKGFTLAGAKGDTAIAATTDEDGHAVLRFNITEDDDRVTVNATNTYSESVFRFMKVDEVGAPLPGATLQILNPDGTVFTEWTSAGEAHEVRGLSYGVVYTLHEVAAPAGHVFIKNRAFMPVNETTLAGLPKDEDGTLLVENTLTRLEIMKVDEAGEPLSGVTLQILDADGHAAAEWNTDDSGEPHDLTGTLNADADYTLHELAVPDGYTAWADIPFHVEKDGSITLPEDYADLLTVPEDGPARITLVNGPTALKVRKLNPRNNRVVGATLALWDAEGNEPLDTWTTVADADWTLPKLRNVATYTIEETEAPAGYEIAPAITFTLNERGEAVDVQAEGADIDLLAEDGVIVIPMADDKTLTELSGTKTWLDGDVRHDNAEDVTLTLTRAIEGGEAEVVDIEPTWSGDTYTFAGLETHDDDSNPYTYTVTEMPIEGYDTTVDATGLNFTNRRTGTIGISGEKTWLDGDNEHVSADEVTLTLTRATEDGEAEVVDAQPTWSGDRYAYSGLAEFDPQGYPYTYAVTEARIDGFRTIQDGYDFTNLREGIVSVTGTKTWIDDVHSHVSAREVTLTLTRLSAGPGSAAETVDAKPAWSGDRYAYSRLAEFDPQGYPYTYTVTETPIDGYISLRTPTETGFDFTNTYRAEGSVTLRATKVLTGGTLAEGAFGFQLKAADGTVLRTARNAADGSVTFDAIGYTEADLADSPITYTISEVEGPAGNIIYADNVETVRVTLVDDGAGNITATPDRSADDITFENVLTTPVPTVAPTDEPTVAPTDGPTATPTAIPTAIPTATPTATPTVTPTPTPTPEPADAPTPVPNTMITGHKHWEDEGNAYGTRPESITVRLYANGTPLDIQPLWSDTDTDHWTYVFASLPAVDSNGQAITYTVDEIPVALYTSTVSGTEITNRLQPRATIETTTLSGAKTWQDNDNAAGKRPGHITVHLLQNGEVVRSVTVTAATDWRYEFDDLPVDDGYGHTYTYTVREDAVPGYYSRTSGMDLINGLLEGTAPNSPIGGQAVTASGSGTPIPPFEEMTDEELEELIDIFGYGTPLFGILPTGDEAPLYPFAFAVLGTLALLAALALAKRRDRT